MCEKLQKKPKVEEDKDEKFHYQSTFLRLNSLLDGEASEMKTGQREETLMERNMKIENETDSYHVVAERL